MAVLYTGCATSPRIAGSAETTQHLFAAVNGLLSKRLLRLRRLAVQKDATALLTAVMPQVKASRVTAASIVNGASLDKGTFDTSQSSDAQIRLVFANTADGSGTGGLVATIGAPMWQEFTMRRHTAIEQVIGDDGNVLPRLVDENFSWLLYPGQALLVSAVAAVATSNPITDAWFLQAVWTEEEFTTFAISGTVTVASSPYAGAEVVVLIADDENMTNLYHWTTVVTGAGGTWTANIPVGKVAFAYAQESAAGPTRYTAEGRPYLKQ